MTEVIGIFTFLFILLVSLWVIGTVVSDLWGAPFLPSNSKDLERLLPELKLRHDDRIVELGCGTARFLRLAARRYHVQGLGIDINPILLIAAIVLAKLAGIRGLQFSWLNLFSADLTGASVVYLYLMPGALAKLKTKLAGKTPGGCRIVSYRFAIPGWDDRLVKTLDFHHKFYIYHHLLQL